MNRKEKARMAAATALMIAIIVSVSFLALNTGYRLGLDEGLSLNREEPESALHGHLTVMVYRADTGVWELAWSEHNVITNAGRDLIRDYLSNDTLTGLDTQAFNYIAIGTGSGGGASSTTLQTEFDRQIATYAEPYSYNFTLTYTWAASSFDGDTISEAGVLNDATTGTLLNYQDFSGITLTSSDSLQVTFEFMISDGGA
jgi:hypothetical protein